MYFNRA